MGKRGYGSGKVQQPTPEKRKEGIKKRYFRQQIMHSVLELEVGEALYDDELGQLYFQFKRKYPNVKDFKKMKVQDVIVQNMARYVLVNKAVEPSKNSLHMLTSLSNNVLEDLSEQLEININLAENPTLKDESEI
jgi:hypothetical protein